MALPLAGPQAQPVVNDAAVSIYATVPDPLSLSFAADGSLYVGRDKSGSGGGYGDAVKIYRVGPGGVPVTEFGNAAIADPDVMIVDVAGIASGTAGAVLVGGGGGSAGKISKIALDGTVTPLFGPSDNYQNPGGFAFDLDNRFLFTCYDNGRVYASAGGPPTLLFSLPHANYLEVDSLNRIVVNSADEAKLRLYTGSGVLSNAAFATVLAGTPLARGPGGGWGRDIYAIGTGGELLRVSLDGTTTNIGSGFATVSDLRFGPDGTLYASDFAGDRVYRFAQPTVAGAVTTIYARVTDPVRLSFAPDGTLFAGRDNAGSGGSNSDAVKIHRIGPGGSPVSEYGNAAITDPNAVFYDATGQFSGTPGAVLVAGELYNNPSGKIVKILPDGTVTTIFGPTGFGFNPNLLYYDVAGGRLLISENEGGKVWTMTNTTPVVLFSLPLAFSLAVDAAGRIVAGTDDNWLRLYSAEGVLLNNHWAMAQASTIIARGPGGFWGTDVYFVGTNWNLMRLDTNGVVAQAGTSFGGMDGFVFGPDGALYASQLNSDLIWRFAPPGAGAPTLTLTTEGNGRRASWSGITNVTYQPQTSTNLGNAAAWENYGPAISGTNGPASFTFSITAEPVRFFRLKSDN